MNIFINDYTYDKPERDRDAFLAELRNDLSELGQVELRDDEVPEAAD